MAGIKDMLFGAKPASAPAQPPVTVMPTPDDTLVQAAKKKKAMEISQRSGRDSTVLTDTGTTDKLGG